MPVLITGTSDENRRFHSICLAICSDERKSSFKFIFNTLKTLYSYSPTVLISDASEAIRNAFGEVFGKDSLFVMCWAHARRNMIKQLHRAPKEWRSDLEKDIDFLQVLL